jgi:hypothetical protein
MGVSGSWSATRVLDKLARSSSFDLTSDDVTWIYLPLRQGNEAEGGAELVFGFDWLITDDSSARLNSSRHVNGYLFGVNAMGGPP